MDKGKERLSKDDLEYVSWVLPQRQEVFNREQEPREKKDRTSRSLHPSNRPPVGPHLGNVGICAGVLVRPQKK